MNNSEIALADKCMRILCEHVGTIDAERFIHFITSNRFDYTEWQREHYDKIPDKELRQNMIEFCKAHPFKGKESGGTA